jgi:hypothetical protein
VISKLRSEGGQTANYGISKRKVKCKGLESRLDLYSRKSKAVRRIEKKVSKEANLKR